MRKFVQWYKKNPGIVLGIALLLKMLLFRQVVIHDITILGIISDVAAIVGLLAIPAILLTGIWRSVLQYFISIVFSVIWFATSIYYSYYGSIPTYLTLSNMKQVGQISASITASLEPYMGLYFIDFILLILMALIWRGNNKPTLRYWVSRPTKKRPRLVAAILFVLSLLVSLSMIYFAKNIENEHALAKRLGVITYQFVVIGEEKKAPSTQLSEEEKAEIQDQLHNWFAEHEQTEHALYHGVAEGRNLIVLQLEAIQNFVIGLKVGDQEVTPNLNALVKESFYFPHIYQQIGEGNTSDAEFLLNTGAYPIGSQAMSKLVGGKEVPSLPRLLETEGYQSYTFHVNDVEFWNRDKMYPALGFTKYFDKPSFENDEFNSFGASDEQLYKVALQKFAGFKQEGQTFYAQLITASSHHPFEIPNEYRTLELPASYSDTQLGNYLQAAHYTDEQIGKFIEQLKQSGMWEQSALAIYGDHFGLQPKDNDAAWVSEQLGIPYHSTISRMNIPFILAIPGVEGETVEQVGGQVDMLPTILNVLGINDENYALPLFGTDLLNTETNVIGTRYYMPTGTFFNDHVLFVPGTGFEDGQAIDLNTFETIKDIHNLRPDYEYILELMRMSDLYTSQFHELEQQ